MKYDLIILTEQRYLNDSKDPYYHNVFYEDELVLKACETKGLKVLRRAWDDKEIDWSQTKAILFRSTWDYFDRFNEFLSWLKEVSQQTMLINSNQLINWNIDKHYLLDLLDKGIHIPETIFIEKGSKKSLSDLYHENGWEKSVLKPCISGAGRHTYVLNSKNIEDYEDLFAELISKEDMMIQLFQNNIVEFGEVSMMVFNGKFTHAVLKKAKAGDFRVQDDFGGTVHDYKPTNEEIQFAMDSVKACPELPLYARVDIFYDNDKQLALGELELVEPELWFRIFPKAADVLANELNKKLS